MYVARGFSEGAKLNDCRKIEDGQLSELMVDVSSPRPLQMHFCSSTSALLCAQACIRPFGLLAFTSEKEFYHIEHFERF